ncbi:MAG: hypothetical protein OXI81_18870 [Paracoccaceae bacterium]|nr:hypothetical protein [Paracoccaceae bacterium]
MKIQFAIPEDRITWEQAGSFNFRHAPLSQIDDVAEKIEGPFIELLPFPGVTEVLRVLAVVGPLVGKQIPGNTEPAIM